MCTKHADCRVTKTGDLVYKLLTVQRHTQPWLKEPIAVIPTDWHQFRHHHLHRRHPPNFFDNKVRTYGEYLLQKAAHSKQLGQAITLSSDTNAIKGITIADNYIVCVLHVNLRLKHVSVFVDVFLPKQDSPHRLSLMINPGNYLIEWMINPWERAPTFVVPTDLLPHIRPPHAYDFTFCLTCQKQ